MDGRDGSHGRFAAQRRHQAQSQATPNAAKESFFASLEKERLRRRTYATHEQARSSVFQYIEEFYNRRRLHSTLGYRSPEEVEYDHHAETTAVAA